MFDWFFGLLSPTQWDALRNWVTTAGALIALLIAANTYRRNVKIKREEQARLIYSKFVHVAHRNPGDEFTVLLNNARMSNESIGYQLLSKTNPATGQWDLAIATAPLIQTTVVIHNGGKEFVGPLRVQMVNGGNMRAWDKFSNYVSEVEPESDYVVEFIWVNEFHPRQPALATTLIFRDASGQWWRRLRSEPIERVHNDPENNSLTPKEREAARIQQEAMGIPEEKRVMEPDVGVRARWHRMIRRLRGKNPIP